ncbi:hypothetical protein [Haloarcula sebkhae]|uniref:Uncharacterized protein n=2 Tax=Haloarcula sebkhae TaxID=932660 RepID=A0ACC6VR57_9EURY|nr:hypothetical protein GCM10009067_34180 [Haloarcula sebkhae]
MNKEIVFTTTDNVAKNISLRYLRRNQTGGEGALGVRLNSKMLDSEWITYQDLGQNRILRRIHRFSGGYLNE